MSEEIPQLLIDTLGQRTREDPLYDLISHIWSLSIMR